VGVAVAYPTGGISSQNTPKLAILSSIIEKIWGGAYPLPRPLPGGRKTSLHTPYPLGASFLALAIIRPPTF